MICVINEILLTNKAVSLRNKKTANSAEMMQNKEINKDESGMVSTNINAETMPKVYKDSREEKDKWKE